MNRFF